MSAILKTELLEALHNVVTHDAYTLYEALTVVVTDDPEQQPCANLDGALEHIILYVQQIATSANKANLVGLQEVCELTQERIVELQSSNKAHREKICHHIERWPRLISNYLISPFHERSRQALMAHLQSNHWQRSLSQEQVEYLTELLSQDFLQFSAISNIAESETTSMLSDTVADVVDIELPKIAPPSTQTLHYSEKLIELSNTVVELSDVLSRALNRLVTEDSESEPFLEALETYTNSVQTLWEKAERAGLSGLQEVCTFINDSVFELSERDQADKFVLHEQLALWPKLVLDYLQNPSDGATHLIKYLQSSRWVSPLTKNRGNHLLPQLLREGAVHYIQTTRSQEYEIRPPTQSQRKPQTVTEKKESSMTLQSSQIQTTVELIPEFSDETLELETDLLTDTDEELTDSDNNFFPEQSATEELFEYDYHPLNNVDETEIITQESSPIEQDIENSMVVSQQANAPRLPDDEMVIQVEKESVQEVDKLLTEEDLALTDDLDYEEQTPAFSTENMGMSGIISELPEIEHYTNHFQDELQLATEDDLIEPDDFIEEIEIQKENTELTTETNEIESAMSEIQGDLSELEELQEIEDISSEYQKDSYKDTTYFEESSDNEVESDEFGDHQIGIPTEKPEIREREAEPVKYKEATHSTKSLRSILSDPNVLDILNIEIPEAIRDLSKALNKFITAPDNSTALLEAVEHYTDNVQAISEQAKIANLGALQEVCSLIIDNLFELSTHPLAVRRTAYAHLSKWPDLVLDYLQTPLPGARNLVNHLSSPLWPYPLNEEQYQTLLTRLTSALTEIEEDTGSLIDDEEDIETASFRQIHDAKEGGLIEDHTETSDRTNQVTQSEEEEIDTLPELNESVTESTEQTQDSDTPLVLAPLEVIELIIGQLQECTEGLTATFNQLMNAKDGSEELLTLVGDYTENVQALWDAADMAHLTGLQEVCTFINDNAMILGGEDKATRLAAREVFEAWPHLAMNYLSSPLLNVFQLVKHLQSIRWPQPLDDNQAEALQQKLTTASTPQQIQEKSLVDHSIDNEAVQRPSQVTETIEETLVDTPTAPTIIELAAPDVLELFIAQLNDTALELSTTFNQFIEAQEGSEELLQAVETYTENVQTVWDTVDMAQLVGLQEVCTFVNDNLVALSGEGQATRKAAKTAFEGWPERAIRYLQNPIEGARQLVAQLQSSEWPRPLEAEEVENLYCLLTRSKINEISHSDKTEKVARPAEKEIVLAAPDVLELVIAQLNDTAIELSTLLTQLVQAKDGDDTLLAIVESYTEQVQAIWDTVDMASLTGLQEVCTFINENITLLASEKQPNRQAAQEIVNAWPTTVITYLQKPAVGAATLVEQLQNTQWPAPLDAQRAQELYALLLKSTTSQSESSPLTSQGATTQESQKTIYLAAPDIIEVVRNQIIDTKDELIAILEGIVSMQNDNPALLEIIENYTNQVQAIWDVADMAGLQGLQEVCSFINDNMMAFGTQENSAKLAAQDNFIQWPNLILGYLQNPGTGAEELVNFLQKPEWPTALESDRAPELLSLLTQSSTSPEQVTAFETEQLAEEQEEEAEEASALEINESQMPGEEGIKLGSAEVLEILSSELETSKEELSEQLQKFTSLNNNEPGFNEAAENYADIVGRLQAAAEMLGLEGLQRVCFVVISNVKALTSKDLAFRGKAKKVLEAWPDLVLGYLKAPMESVIPMLNHFREPQWARPLSDEDAHTLLTALTQGSTAEENIEEASAYTRQTVATPEDVILAPPEDINRDLLEAYLQETPQYASDFSQVIQKIIAEPQVPDIERAQRIAHTLKGSSNIIGIKGVANMGHHLEDILEYLAKNRVSPPKELTDVMVEAADCLEMMVDYLTGQGDPPDNAQSVLQAVLDWANRIDKGDLSAPPARASTPSAAPAKAAETVEKTKPSSSTKANDGAAPGTPEQMLRVPTRTVDELMRLVGEMSISLGQIQERVKHVLGSTRVLTEQGFVLQKKTFELENLVDVRGITGITSHGDITTANIAGNEVEFDSLEFEEYNELHSVAHSFIESIADSRELAMSIRHDMSELEGMIIQQERLNKEFQLTIMTTRMVPVATIVSKLQRNIRQTCRATNKEAELEVIGTEILIDSDVLNNLGDPLQHMLRNAIDHGLETPDEREMLGKPRSGLVKLSFYREGNSIVVSCQDDGQGLNYTNIRYTAIQRGLITEAQEMTEQDLARLILMSGFSTKSGVTQVSGRGVGMDVVHTNIRQMKGTLDISSETGKGTNFVIKLPMTLVTLHVLLVRVGSYRYGIPTNAVEQALAPGANEFQKIGEDVFLKMGKNLYSIKDLAGLLSVTGDREGIDGYESRPIVLIHEETGLTAVIVDELLDTHDLVMKSMGRFVTKVRGVSGASILGDGSLVPLLDLPELLRSPLQSMMSSFATEGGSDTAPGLAAQMPRILIVDDSLSVRKSLSLLVEEAGYETLIAKDGLEAIEVMGQARPNVMLVDMEMPRMNGLELTSHVRANKATEKIPIFMITSRTTEKHREQAKTAGVSAYLTKPYQDAELLELIERGIAGKI